MGLMITRKDEAPAPGNLQQYKDEAADILDKFFGNIAALGEMLRRAAKDLLAWEYQELERFLLTYLTQSDLKAAMAVAEGRLKPELFPAGLRNSKVLSLSEIRPAAPRQRREIPGLRQLRPPQRQGVG